RSELLEPSGCWQRCGKARQPRFFFAGGRQRLFKSGPPCSGMLKGVGPTEVLRSGQGLLFLKGAEFLDPEERFVDRRLFPPRFEQRIGFVCDESFDSPKSRQSRPRHEQQFAEAALPLEDLLASRSQLGVAD